MKLFALLFAILIQSPLAYGKIEVLFHPHDATLDKISSWIETSSTVDIAMYNMDVTDKSPVIRLLKREDLQERLSTGKLKIRMVFEGYSSSQGNAEKMQALEDLGIDVRFLGAKVKVHHKFAIMDASSHQARVVTGSANWSVSSEKNYNENILFVTEESEITSRFQTEFDRLWFNAQEYGRSLSTPNPEEWIYLDQPDVGVYFNTTRTVGEWEEPNSHLTTEVVRTIAEARNEILIASTRARLIPILEALLEAAKRGVKVSLLINQDDYWDLYKRADYLLMHPNIETRVKIFNLKLSDYLSYQMHNKFLIADRSVLLTGSFNWSKSSEYNHIENLIELRGEKAQEVLPEYTAEFLSLWNLNRDQYDETVENLNDKTHTECAIPQMSLNVSEIKALLKLAPEPCRKKKPGSEQST